MLASLLLLILSDAGTEAALKAAVAAVAPGVVRIETSGGRGTAGSGRGEVRKGDAPTTGLVVSADGFVVTSSFNFADKPSDVFVTVPGRPRQVAKVVAADATRMLTLLKIDAAGLPVPTPLPAGEVKVGAWAAAVGRALAPDPAGPPAVSVGVVSAVGRVWGKLVQTDCKVSPVNYGGPLVALDGRVVGVLVPASPDADGDTAGAEWYDSGVGFAVPLADVLAVLQRWKDGAELQRGRLGFTPKLPDEPYTAPVVVGRVAPGSPLDRAGVKPGDVLTAVDGKPAANFSRLQHLLGPKYAGDAVTVTVRSGDESRDVVLTLSGAEQKPAAGFFGILPDGVGPGVGVRYVFADSPAAAAGLKPSDRLTRIGVGDGPLVPLPGRAELAGLTAGSRPGTELSVERKRGDAAETVKLTLAAVPDAVPDDLPARAPSGKPDPTRPTGIVRRTGATTGRPYWVFVPESLRADSKPGLVVWLHPAGRGGRDAEAVVGLWKKAAAERGLMLVAPESANPGGWLASESEAVLTDVHKVADEFKADPARVAVVGVGAGGRMAFHLGFTARDLVRGVGAVGAELGTKPRDPEPGRPLAFFLGVGEKDPRRAAVTGAADDLRGVGYPAMVREMVGVGADALDGATAERIAAWVDCLDRL